MTHTERLRTIVLINVASVLEKCDEQILPALYSKVGASFEATPTQLGKITLARAFMQALSSPLAGVISTNNISNECIDVHIYMHSLVSYLHRRTN